MEETSDEYYDRRISEILPRIKPGTKVKIVYNKGNRNNKTYHVLGIFDDIQIAMKTYKKFNWHYYFETAYWLVILDDGKHLTIIP